MGNTVTHFTLYLMNNNLIYIPDDLSIINEVLDGMGIVITD